MGSDDFVAPFRLEYTYKQSTGPVIGRFLTGLRDGRIEGVRCEDGLVLVPPAEADPRTGRDTGEPVDVGPDGVVTAWTWVATPRPSHPHDTPFAFALIQLDGADVPFVHTVTVPDESQMSTGMRVTAVWAEERVGAITDIVGFAPTGEDA